jgi:hypothetical protein
MTGRRCTYQGKEDQDNDSREDKEVPDKEGALSAARRGPCRRQTEN